VFEVDGKTKVYEFYLFFVYDQNVLEFNISVCYVVLMAIGNCLNNLLKNGLYLMLLQPSISFLLKKTPHWLLSCILHHKMCLH